MIQGLKQYFKPRPAAEPEVPLQAVNITRGTTLATRLESAHSSATRKKGLLGREALLPGEGLWIAPCESVHTFFMLFPIDLVYIDRKKRVKKVRHNVGAWRFSACLTAHSVLELPAGTAEATGTKAGDILAIAPVEDLG